MKLPFFSTKSSPAKDSFFGLFLKERKGIGYIFSGSGGRIALQGKQEFKYSNGWDNLTEDVDEVLFKLENESKCRIEKTIFFLFSHLIDESSKEIKKPYIQKIKDLTKNLEIKPIGYIECYEAVAAYLAHRESAPLTSILVELDDTNVDVFIYKGGHKISNHVVARTSSITDDLHQVFDTAGRNTLLPNRIILYNSSSLIEESTKIISHRWSSELFVQTPRVEILKEEDILTGLMSVFEQQIYREEVVKEPEVEEKQKEVMGFVVGQDIKLIRDNDKGHEEEPEIQTQHKAGLAHDMMKTLGAVTLPSFKFKPGNPIKYAAFAGILLVVSILLAGFEFLFHKAQVRAVFPSSTIDKRIDAKAMVDEEKEGAITVHIATSSIQLKEVKATTGKRDIGENAKGEVTVFNFDDKEKTFAKGTTIEVDNLSFTLDEDIKVGASTLANDASAKLPGKAKVRVTAKEIGNESNIDKGKRFRIADLSTSVYFAMNESGFSGGTRKSIKTVARKDIDDLASLLLTKAKKEQKKAIYDKKARNITIIDSLISYDMKGESYSKELGEEGDNVSLNATVVTSYYYFDNSAFNTTLKREAEKDIPTGYMVEDKNFAYEVKDVEQEGEDITFTLRLKAKATKKLDMQALKSSLRFKQVQQTEQLLKNEFGAETVSVDVSPSMPIISAMLPFFDANILLRIESR